MENKIIMIGESIHGVSEFTSFKCHYIKTLSAPGSILIFEADSLGMYISFLLGDTPRQQLENFPKVHQTREMLGLLSCAREKNIICLGADVIPRRHILTFPPGVCWRSERQAQADVYHAIKAQAGYFALRDKYMAKAIMLIRKKLPGRNILVLMHNLHIKKNGSAECPSLRLKSTAENLRERRLDIHSIALMASSGTACHNTLERFSFDIHDENAIEDYHHDREAFAQIAYKNIPAGLIAYHHAFEAETIPLQEQYDECVVFSHVHPPEFI
ncbi:hypothetical protein [Acerihabitans arboris]|uniref:Erythromycin esterase n=1 Tax=Acerihabitans arboris TaxID=2691583 RepID=A0A845SIP6_9GAMM|nr:hypothetical protein [Acerihabitans arboris]NDL63809.1 hypothetical protein [Acerihabitans arboris]